MASSPAVAHPDIDLGMTHTDMESCVGIGDVLFDTSNTKLVFENQFVEFVTAMPEEYNLYGLGETIHALRLGNNFTKTMWNADNADTVDRNIYGTHPVYYDTRYYESDNNG